MLFLVYDMLPFLEFDILDIKDNIVNEKMNDKIKSALKAEIEGDFVEVAEEKDESQPISKIATTFDEIEAFYAIKSILAQTIPTEKITYKDTESYFGILFENNTRKWICRIHLDGIKKSFIVPDENKNGVKYYINDLYNYQYVLIKTVKRYRTD